MMQPYAKGSEEIQSIKKKKRDRETEGNLKEMFYVNTKEGRATSQTFHIHLFQI